MSEHATPDPAAEDAASPDPADDGPPSSDTPPETRSLEKEVEIDAPAEAVWKAVSEAEELVRWFPLEARVEPGEGGSIYLSWGEGMGGEARIDVWEPGRRLRWIQEGDMAVDVTIEGRGGRSVVRLVQSGFSAESEWDDYYDATDTGWSFYLLNLKHYLERHGGAASEILYVRRDTERSKEEAWTRLTGSEGLAPEPALEVDGGPSVEEGASVSPAGEERNEGATVRLGDERRRLDPWLVRPGRALAGRLPDLDDATLIVEMEPGRAERWHCGFWLYTWGLAGERREDLQGALDELAGRVTG